MTDGVGAEIRVERARRGWSLEQLSEASGISSGWIGQVERGSAAPSITVVRRIADALGVSTASLLGDKREDQAPDGAPGGGIQVVRRARRTALRFPDSQHFFEVLTPNLRGQLQVLFVEISPDEPHPIESFSHPGEELFFVIKGEVILEVEGQQVSLSAGDSATIASIMPHRLRNAGEDKAEVLTASTPPFL